MHCHVYKGTRAPDTYVYLAGKDDFEGLPDDLLARLGTLQWVMDLELSAERPLARADVLAVMRALEDKGYYLQLPPPREALMGNDRLPR